MNPFAPARPSLTYRWRGRYLSLVPCLILILVQGLMFALARASGRDNFALINIDFFVALAVGYWWPRLGLVLFCLVGVLVGADFVASAYYFDLVPFLRQAGNLRPDMLWSNLPLVGCGLLGLALFIVIGRLIGSLHPIGAIACIVIFGALQLLQGSGALHFGNNVRRWGNIDVAKSALLRVGVQLSNGAPLLDPRKLPHGEAAMDKLLLNGQRSVILVIVESLGARNDDAADNFGYADVLRAHPSLHTVTRGTVHTLGGTLAGELRELCGVRVGGVSRLTSYAGCRPNLFRSTGHATFAVHSYRGNFFGRDGWWPLAGFGRTIFKDQRDGLYGRCKGALDALCDAPMLSGELAAVVSQPKFFFYFLSSNTHLPLSGKTPLEAVLPVAFDRLLGALETTLRASGRHDVDIVVVGDHPPPLMGPSRKNYLTDRVPYWVMRLD